MVNAVLIVSLAIIYYSALSYLYIAYIHVLWTLANSLGSTIKWEYLKDAKFYKPQLILCERGCL